MGRRKGDVGSHTKPVELKVLEGGDVRHQKRKLNLGKGYLMPEPRTELGENGLRQWTTVGKKLREVGILHESDMFMFEEYCKCIDHYCGLRDEFDNLVATVGYSEAVILRSEKGVIKRNPLVEIKKSALKDVISLAQHFGLDPVSRARLGLLENLQERPGQHDHYFATKQQANGRN